MAPYSFIPQTKIIMACFSIDNFLRKISIVDRLFYESNNEVVELESENSNQTSTMCSFFIASNQVFM